MVISYLFFSSKNNNSTPFENVYFTGILRDLKKNKISKSLGNSPDLESTLKLNSLSILKTTLLEINTGADFIFKDSVFKNKDVFLKKIKNALTFFKKTNTFTL
jgi:valyl-tRNA synthetase